MTVNDERMRRNLELGRGLVFSGQLLLELTGRGMRREDAYRVVQGHAMEAWKTEGDFRARGSRADPAVRAVLSESEIDEVFRLERYLGARRRDLRARVRRRPIASAPRCR